MQSKWSLYVGRFQPFHAGHASFIRALLAEGRKVCVAVMDTEPDAENPLGYADRVALIRGQFPDEGNVRVVPVPPVAEVVYGRNCGYGVRRVFHKGENVSATAIRTGRETPEPNPFDDPEFLTSYRRVAERQYEVLAAHGFWDWDIVHPAILIAKAHSELSEALECFRLGNPPDKNIGEYTGGEVQLSDCLGVLMGMEVGLNLHVSEALLRKQRFNVGRPQRHGGKTF